MNEAIWKGASGYTVGRSHEKEQKPCQDRTLVLTKNGVTFAGVCDGAGSASHSQYGAEMSLHVVSEIVTAQFDEYLILDEEQLKSQLIESIEVSLDTLAIDYRLERSAFASTLLFVATTETHYISGHLGDGLIVLLKDRTAIHSHPDNGTYANVTYFTTSTDARSRLRIQRGELDNISGFFLMSDGTSHSMYRKQDDFIAPAIATIMDWLKEHDEQTVNEAIARSLEKSIKQKTFDDCALSVIVRSSSSLSIEQ